MFELLSFKWLLPLVMMAVPEGGGAEGKGAGAAEVAGDSPEPSDAEPAPGDKSTEKPAEKPAPEGPKSMREALEESFKSTARAAGKEIPEKPAPDATKPEKEAKTPIGDKEKPSKEAKTDAKPDDKKDKKPDPKTLHELPEGLSAPAQERFRALSATVKEQATELARVSGAHKELESTLLGFQKILKDTQTSPEDFDRMLAYNQAVKSGNLETAFKVVEAEYKALAQRMGKKIPGYDLLEDFPDLKTQVSDFKITEDAALEIAKNRRENAAREEAARRNAAEQGSKRQTDEQTLKSVHESLDAIGAWTKELSENDLDFKIKEGKLLPIVDEVVKTYLPHQWLPTLKLAYANITVEKVPAAVPGARPIRAGGAPTGAVTEPKSMFEAQWGHTPPGRPN